MNTLKTTLREHFCAFKSNEEKPLSAILQANIRYLFDYESNKNHGEECHLILKDFEAV